MKILTYKLTADTGFAPNPFHGVLTLAACTPNHMRANLEKGDYIVGIESNELMEKRKKAGLCPQKDNLLIYIAEVSEILSLNDYFHDPRFENKKYRKDKCWILEKGDNVYYKDGKMWKWLRGHAHDNKTKVIYKDIYGNKVFICKRFTYFGDKCEEFNKKFEDCIVKRQGIKYCQHSHPKFIDFKKYLDSLIGKGRIGKPIYCHIKSYCKDEECEELY